MPSCGTMGDENVRFPLKALVTALVLFLATPGTPALAHGVEEGGWGEVPPWAYLAVVLAAVVSGLLLSTRGAFRRPPVSVPLPPRPEAAQLPVTVFPFVVITFNTVVLVGLMVVVPTTARAAKLIAELRLVAIDGAWQVERLNP